MGTGWSIFNRRFHLLVRGEKSVALMGIGAALILLFCFTGAAWLTDREDQDTARAAQLDELNAIGPLLARSCRQFIAGNDLAGLRNFTAGLGTKLGLKELSVSISGGRVLADTVTSNVNQQELPEHWTADASQEYPGDSQAGSLLQFHFSVPSRGGASLNMLTLPCPPFDYSRFSSSGLTCAVGLCLLVFVYHRSRIAMAQTEVIRTSLNAVDQGETAIEALQVDPSLGGEARAWNKVLAELSGLRKRNKIATVASPVGNRRSGGNNLEAACDAMSQGLILVDDKMKVRFSNGAACTFLNQDRGALSGIPAADLVKDPKYEEGILAIASGKSRRAVTVEIERVNDTGPGILRFCIRPVRRGDADSAMIIIEDITQQRAAERARNSFINQVTHELRTPLTNIRLYTETAIEDGESNPQVRANCLNVINQESRRLERIVSEMLSVAEIEAGSSTVKKDEIYFDALLTELHADYKAQAAEKEIVLSFAVAPKLPKLIADKDKLAIAMHNLIGNALKYTPKGGKVTVNVDMRDEQLAIDVADTGIGIKPEEAEKIFDRFFRSADPRVGQIVGTGLGLTLAREVMRLHGGDVTVQSVLNRGSTFTASMPVTAAA